MGGKMWTLFFLSFFFFSCLSNEEISLFGLSAWKLKAPFCWGKWKGFGMGDICYSPSYIYGMLNLHTALHKIWNNSPRLRGSQETLDEQRSRAPGKESRGVDGLQVAVKTEGDRGKAGGATDAGRGVREEPLRPFLTPGSKHWVWSL